MKSVVVYFVFVGPVIGPKTVTDGELETGYC